MNTKICSSCKQTKSVEEFYRRTGKESFHSQCKNCERGLAKNWYKRNPEYAKRKASEWRKKYPERIKEYRIANRRKSYISESKRKYGISEVEFNNLLLRQKNRCIGCGLIFEFGVQNKTPHIDHSHKTGKVRGLLCRRCNSVIGFYDDNSAPLFSLGKYLKCHG
jgi:hypothetical protein